MMPSPPEATDLDRWRTAVSQLSLGPLATREQARDLCEAAGRLRLRDREVPPLATEAGARLEARLREGLGLAKLADEASLLIELLDEADDTAEPNEATSRDTDDLVREALAARDLAEWIVEGARALLGSDRGLHDDDALGVAIFDETLDRELPRMTRWNHVRAERETTAAPAERARFRWRYDGVGIDPTAWDAMSAVAALVARYPGAEQRFRALVAAEHGMQSPASRGLATSTPRLP